MKKIYSTHNILYILLFILVFILGIMLIKYMVSKKETFLNNPFTDGLTNAGSTGATGSGGYAMDIHSLYGPPDTFISCYNPLRTVKYINITRSTSKEMSYSFLFHATMYLLF